MKKKDFILIAVVLLVAVGAFAFKVLTSDEGAKAIVTVDGKVYGEYSLDENQTINIDDHNTIIIKDGVVHMEDANCPDKLCIKQGEIHYNSEKIVCLPNKTIVEIESDEESEYDVKTK